MHTTDSGLKVLVRETPGVQVATVDAWVATGAANETSEIGGISHFLEHMLFKGTSQFAAGDMDRLVEGMGGVLNAGTSLDFTHYYMTVPSEHTAKALGALADSLMNSTLPREELDKERGVVLEEINRKEDNPFGYLYERIHQTAFVTGPYRESVLGEASTITALPRETMMDYYRRYYVPENIVLVVVGDVKAKDIAQAADQAFAGFDRQARPFEALERQMRWNDGADIEIEKDVSEIYSATGYPSPSLEKAREVVAADVLQSVLACGRSSRLLRELKESRQIVTSISASFPTQRYETGFYIFATVAPDKAKAYRQALDEELARACQVKFTDDELRRAKRLLINDHYFSKETTSGASGIIGYYYTLTGSLDFEKNYVDEIDSITAEEVRDAARRIFDPAKAVRVALCPKP